MGVKLSEVGELPLFTNDAAVQATLPAVRAATSESDFKDKIAAFEPQG